MGATGGEGVADETANHQRGLWAGIVDGARQKIGRSGIAMILLSQLAVLGPLILLAVVVGADAFGGPDVAFVVSLSLAVIGVGALLAMFFIDVNDRRMNKEVREAFYEDRKKNEEDRKKNEELRNAFDEYREENRKLRRAVERLADMVDGGAGGSGPRATGEKFTGRDARPAPDAP